jgi:hypothetical protein
VQAAIETNASFGNNSTEVSPNLPEFAPISEVNLKHGAMIKVQWGGADDRRSATVINDGGKYMLRYKDDSKWVEPDVGGAGQRSSTPAELQLHWEGVCSASGYEAGIVKRVGQIVAKAAKTAVEAGRTPEASAAAAAAAAETAIEVITSDEGEGDILAAVAAAAVDAATAYPPLEPVLFIDADRLFDVESFSTRRWSRSSRRSLTTVNEAVASTMLDTQTPPTRTALDLRQALVATLDRLMDKVGELEIATCTT